jgi:CBS domain containing-hemolysin-like protein
MMLLGLYLCAALLVSAWRRASESVAGVGVWVALLGAWTIAAHTRWFLSSMGTAFFVGLAWLVVTALLIRAGSALATRNRVRGLVWLLGPLHALALAGSWFAAARLKRKAASLEVARRHTGGQVHAALESVVELGETTLEEVLVPRSEIDALSERLLVRDWLEMVKETRRNRLPVYREDLDEITGYLSSEELFSVPAARAPVKEFIRPIRFVPESMRCDDLLRDLISQGEKIAIVVDEFGGTAGLVTDQDLFEILLGEIDQGSAALGLWKLEDGAYLADGSLRIDDFNDFFRTQLPEGDYETLAGLILERLGKIPAKGERLNVDRVSMEVAASSERRILRIRIEFAPEDTGAGGGDAESTVESGSGPAESAIDGEPPAAGGGGS